MVNNSTTRRFAFGNIHHFSGSGDTNPSVIEWFIVPWNKERIGTSLSRTLWPVYLSCRSWCWATIVLTTVASKWHPRKWMRVTKTKCGTMCTPNAWRQSRMIKPKLKVDDRVRSIACSSKAIYPVRLAVLPTYKINVVRRWFTESHRDGPMGDEWDGEGRQTKSGLSLGTAERLARQVQ